MSDSKRKEYADYYTPHIKEFHIGFECEILSSYGWQEGIYPDILQLDSLTNISLQHDGIIQATKEASLRVKYLDQEDIESLGFKYITGYGEVMVEDGGGIIYVYENNNIAIHFEAEYIVKDKRQIIIFKNKQRVFDGCIKNKSELIKILKQTNCDLENNDESPGVNGGKINIKLDKKWF